MDPQIARWAASGALELTGRADGPPIGPPRPLLDLLDLLDEQLGVDSAALLAERAAIAGLRRRSPISCGGGTRLLSTADGWLALTLARPEDVELIPAWLELDSLPGALSFDAVAPEQPAPFGAVAALVASRRAADLDERAAEFGLPAAALGVAAEPTTTGTARVGAQPTTTGTARVAAQPTTTRTARVAAEPTTTGTARVAAEPVATAFGLPVRATPFEGRPRRSSGSPGEPLRDLTVVDLSSLWAGPLAGRLLGEAGPRVLKVESVQRPDGARRGPTEFYERLNGAKQHVRVDFTTADGRAELHDLLRRADVVIEGSRPRALEHLGIVAAELLEAADGPTVWVSITGFGRAEPWRNRVAFGDVAAVAGGLVVYDDRGPCFVADAVADPVSGMVAAAATLATLRSGGRWLLDVAMAGVSAHVAGEPVPIDLPAEPGR
ncbi:MAG TPA: CoA transferase [Acidimicrobiales bacterium]|nr:CoA transferase [Acidimicrobiales bacterium]